ncbi:MAG: hypothetical protein Q4B42_05810, partial [Oscillospiraceae bacterium]|nr:hypothetical protein [Oscillospiraceae bacterium]
ITDIQVDGAISREAEMLITVSGAVGDNEVVCISPDGAADRAERLSAQTFIYHATQNGVYTVSVGNGEEARREITITTVDREGPKVMDYQYSGGLLTVSVADEMSNTVIKASYLESESGSRISPYSANEGELSFRVSEGEYHLYLEDSLGNTSKFSVSIE